MGRNRLTIGQFKVKNLPFVDGVFSIIVHDAETVTITRSEVSTGKRGRKPFVYHIQAPIEGGTYTGTLEPAMTLAEAMAPATPAIEASGASDGGSHE
jgi:hypothetical protein